MRVFEIKSDELKVSVLDYGAAIMRMEIKNKLGHYENITLGFNHPDDYLNNIYYMGVIVGRYSNRIGGGNFTIDGQRYHVGQNEGINTLHGGPIGFSGCKWKPIFISSSAVTLELISPDGDQGFPGELRVQISYIISGKSLIIDYAAISSMPTVISLTSHPYFNLNGSADIYSHKLMINSNYILETNKEKIPTGKIVNIEATELDFSSMKSINRNVRYDFSYVLKNSPGASNPALIASLYETVSGRKLNIYSSEPCLQFYDGHLLNAPYEAGAGLCLEPQAFPDAPNHQNFPSAGLRPGELWRSQSIYELFF